TGARYAWMVDLPALHEEMFRLVAENHGTLLTSAVIVVFSILLIAYLCGSLRWHTPLYLLSRFSFEVSQFVIVCISFDAVILWFDSGVNLWGQLGGVVASLPFLTLGAACYGFWMYDFNYPLQDRIARNFAMPILSGLIIGISSFL
ncbi:MAG: hypothetical protein OEL66_10870, partial [Desulfobulbaceae bacterium]|nr:hypothetical protein [Desulfobulbaceae bacterium]